MKSDSKFEEEVESLLRKGEWKYVKSPVVGDARPDFLVTTDHGDQIVVEVKGWKSSSENTGRALHQVQRYRELTKAAAALVVSGTGEVISSSMGGVVPIYAFLSTLTQLSVELSKKRKPVKPQPVKKAPKKKVFASMPFAPEFDDTFLVAIEPAALAKGAIAQRVDHQGSPGNVVKQIYEMIREAEAVVADLSKSRPNVLHEVGFAEALGKPVIQICSTPASSLPFNIRNNQTMQYSIGQTTRLRKKLEKEIEKFV